MRGKTLASVVSLGLRRPDYAQGGDDAEDSQSRVSRARTEAEA